MGKLFRSSGVLLWVSLASGCSGYDSTLELLGSEEQAAEGSYDRPALAAFEHKRDTHSFYGVVGIPVLVACDKEHNLMVTYRHLLNGWMPWQQLDSGCLDVPAVAKWTNPAGHDAAAIYYRYSDNHLWEIYFPDLEASSGFDLSMTEHYFSDISVYSGYGEITDSPVLADSDDTNGEEVSLVVRNTTRAWKPISTVVLTGNAWAYYPMTSTATANTIATRGHMTPGGYAYMAGRGLSDETTAWFARRTGFSGKYNRINSLQVDSGISGGAPAPLTPHVDASAPEIEVAKFDSKLKYRNVTDGTGWHSFGTCVPTGGPRIATKASGDGALLTWVRGGEYTTQIDDLMYASGGGGNCTSVGGAIASAPTPIEYATFDYTQMAAAYKRQSGDVGMWSSDYGHEVVSGIKLPF